MAWAGAAGVRVETEGRWVGRALGEGTMGGAPAIRDLMEAASEKLPGRWRPFH